MQLENLYARWHLHSLILARDSRKVADLWIRQTSSGNSKRYTCINCVSCILQIQHRNRRIWFLLCCLRENKQLPGAISLEFKYRVLSFSNDRECPQRLIYYYLLVLLFLSSLPSPKALVTKGFLITFSWIRELLNRFYDHMGVIAVCSAWRSI